MRNLSAKDVSYDVLVELGNNAMRDMALLDDRRERLVYATPDARRDIDDARWKRRVRLDALRGAERR